MPPANTARRNRLADAAMEILAGHGAHGLTHRAVDTATGEPPGTTSRYFRTRDALFLGVVERAREQHFDDLRQAAFPALDKAALGERLSAIVLNALTVNRSRHLAMAELFLEATRRPGLRQAMTETRASQIQLISNLHQAAGVEISQQEATLLVATITGLVLVALTTPGVL
ncbi:TetR family transcriptional regulator [Rhizocola hellebori]|uniref:TetR family transcriptional regulator n=1 Tax=Rhizocola hellebori TaxID=1392758 RepID=A0A8J3VBV1_9ACTN|nr:TetR family transcriptional regulator [Rhizocola hellebori]GIH02004.1 TetR family transcriptional regulator [Rhizocola hellebori]